MGTNAATTEKEILLLVLLEVALLTVFLLEKARKIIFLRMCFHFCFVVRDCFLTVVTLITDFGHQMMDLATCHHLLVR